MLLFSKAGAHRIALSARQASAADGEFYATRRRRTSARPRLSTPRLERCGITRGATFTVRCHALLGHHWQKLNLARASDAAKEKIYKSRKQSLEFIVSFTRIAKVALARGGSVSFEWPRYCSGWKTPEVANMIKELQLTAVDVDGCSVGVERKADGEPILKPWRFMVSSPHLAAQLQDFRCHGGHRHVPCSGADTARSAFYPEELCEAVHKGLDEHERCARPPRKARSGQPLATPGLERKLAESNQAIAASVRPAGVVHDVCRSGTEPGVVHNVCRSAPEELTGQAETSGGPKREAHRLHLDPNTFGLWSGLVTP